MNVTEDWRCSGCGESVPGGFDVCWNCGADRGGIPDPSFVPAVGFTPQCECCGYLLHGLPTLICPECGTPYDPTAKDTFRDLPEATWAAAGRGDASPLSGDSVLHRLTLGVPYRSGPLARTDLHAGGIFFCVIYEEFLQFEPGNQVRRWAEIVGEMAPLDDEADQIRASREVGVYRVNHRGHLECRFTDLELCGTLSEQAPDLLAFHLWRPWTGVQFGRVYRRDVP